MSEKCKRGYKKVGNRCVNKKVAKIFGRASDEISVMWIAILAVIGSFGGWALFTGITRITRLENASGWILIIVGLTVPVVAYKLGLNRFKKII